MNSKNVNNLVNKFAKAYILDTRGVSLESLPKEEQEIEIEVAKEAVKRITSTWGVSYDDVDNNLTRILEENQNKENKSLDKSWG